jgi:hypothetical protein
MYKKYKEKMESFVEYRIYNCSSTLDQIKLLISEDTKEYIWFKRGFTLKDCGAYFQGRNVVGDCLDDEWFIVYILWKISCAYPEAFIQISDSDGEFLLIEAADYLPDWISPENSENKVFMKNGQILLVPEQKELHVNEAISLMQKKDCYDKLITDCIIELIKEYPGKAVRNNHTVNCWIPKNLYKVLSDDPQLISLGVESFYYRDSISLKYCASPKYFSPEKSEFVKAPVKFAKMHYAQLSAQQFNAPKAFQSITKSVTKSITSQEQDKALDIGVKLTCGFEILLNDPLFRNFSGSYVNWSHYKRRLETMGYFEEQVQGSQKYQELEKKAKEAFKEYSESLSENVITHEELLNRLGNSSDIKPFETFVDDDESWMNEKVDEKDEEAKLTDIMEKLSAFMEAKSGLEGVENDSDSDTPESEIDSEDYADDIKYIQGMIDTLKTWKPTDESMSMAQDLDSGDEESESDDEEIKKLPDSFYQLMKDLHPNYEENTNNLKNKSKISEELKQAVENEQGIYGPTSALLDSMIFKKNK